MGEVLSSAHVHTTFCDGKSTAEELAVRACELGFVSLGFTSHAPQTFDEAHCINPANENEYKTEIRSIQNEYKGKMAVYLGIERDLFSCSSPEDYDYFIASVHYFMKPDGSYVGVDGAAEELQKYIDEYCGGSGLEMAKQYFSLFRDYVLDFKPAIIGHFDLLRYNNSILHLYDEESLTYRKMALDALRDMYETSAFLEVNTGGVARGYMKAPYPAPFLLKEWKEWGGEVIINSDCHDAKLLDAGYSQAKDILLSLGYDHVVRLSSNPREGMWEQVGLL
jgi:histidinol-phosphatase (PHP family)